MKLTDVRTISTFELRRLLRSPHGLLFLVFFLAFYGWVAYRLYAASGKLASLGPLGLNSDFGEGSPLHAVLSMFLDDGKVQAVYQLFNDHPPVLLGYFVVALFFMGLFTMLAAFDQTASDIGTRHIRYLLLRTDRASLYVGKTVGVVAFLAIAMAFVSVVVGAVVLGTDGAPGFSAIEVVLYLLRIWVTLCVYSLPFVALLGLAGALVGHGFLALVIALGYWLFVLVVSGIGGMAVESMGYVEYAFPTALKYGLLFDGVGYVLPALAHQLGFAALFFVAGLLVFRRRDV